MEINYLLISVVLGSIIDSLIGDPYKLPHPIRVFGNAISKLESLLNRGSLRKLKGVFMWLILVGVTWISFYYLITLLVPHPWILCLFTAIFFFYGLSNRCLIDEGLKVERLLQKDKIHEARKQLSMIVGRDTSKLSGSKIRTAVIETLSENLSDGVVAPIFFFAIGGIPLMMAYKMINTLDSMVGYKNDRYQDFGFFSAKMDDLANLIPARLTAIFMVLVSLSKRGFVFIFQFGKAHSSPNAGYPESALAGILDCRLGGTSDYFGKTVEKPFIGYNNRELKHRDVIQCCWINAKVAILCYTILSIILWYK